MIRLGKLAPALLSLLFHLQESVQGSCFVRVNGAGPGSLPLSALWHRQS